MKTAPQPRASEVFTRSLKGSIRVEASRRPRDLGTVMVRASDSTAVTMAVATSSGSRTEMRRAQRGTSVPHGEFGVDEAGEDGGDADALGMQLAPEGFGEADDEMLGAAVGCEARFAGDTRERGDVHDVAVAPGGEAVGGEAGAGGHTADVDVDLTVGQGWGFGEVFAGRHDLRRC